MNRKKIISFPMYHGKAPYCETKQIKCGWVCENCENCESFHTYHDCGYGENDRYDIVCNKWSVNPTNIIRLRTLTNLDMFTYSICNATNMVLEDMTMIDEKTESNFFEHIKNSDLILEISRILLILESPNLYRSEKLIYDKCVNNALFLIRGILKYDISYILDNSAEMKEDLKIIEQVSPPLYDKLINNELY